MCTEEQTTEEEKKLNPGTAIMRVCESEWHEQVKLRKFEQCPICKSKSIHKTIIVKVEDQEDEAKE